MMLLMLDLISPPSPQAWGKKSLIVQFLILYPLSLRMYNVSGVIFKKDIVTGGQKIE